MNSGCFDLSLIFLLTLTWTLLLAWFFDGLFASTTSLHLSFWIVWGLVLMIFAGASYVFYDR